MSLKPLFLVVSLLLLLACSDRSGPEALAPVSQSLPATKPAPRFRVSETFDVGRNVFVRSLSFDEKHKTLWVGTSVGVLAVDVATLQVKNTYTRDNGLANEYVFASYVDATGDVWFGTNGGGVSRLTPQGWKTYFPMHGLADYWVYSFAEQADKAMWIGTWAGLSRFDYATQGFKTYLKELVNEWVYGLDVDAQGNLWIGTEGGVNRFDGKNWSVWTHKDGLGAPNIDNLDFSPNTGLGTRSRHDLSVMLNGRETYNPNYVFCIKALADGTVWAGTWGGGVSWFDGSRWNNLTTADGLAGNIVFSMQVDEKEKWFGTNHGLSYYDGDQWQTIGTAEGLLDYSVYALARDDQGRLWVGTRNGVALVTRIPAG